MKRLLMIGVPMVLVLGLAAAAVANAHSTNDSCDADPVPFKDARLIVETNATDGDAGLQVFLDHEPWRSIEIYRPDGERLLGVTARGELTSFGLTELFAESSEPPFTDLPLAEFQELFPAGEYRYEGCTVDGQAMRSPVTLTHAFPAGPEILSPQEDSTVAAAEVVVRWEPVTTPPGIEIVRYQILLTNEEQAPPQVFSADLPATTSELTVPAGFVEPGVEYKVEVVAVEAGGNQTLTELAFSAG
jgi:Fibronectin type III domain